jgi:hypothetical protein
MKSMNFICLASPIIDNYEFLVNFDCNSKLQRQRLYQVSTHFMDGVLLIDDEK